MKLKISGQFKNINYVGYFATLGSSLETCRRNNINEFDATEEMCEGDPYTLSEILKTDRQLWVTP